MNRVIITFCCTHDAIAAQRTLERHALPFRVLPTPETISSTCGIAVMIDAELAPQCKAALQDSGTDATYTAAVLEGRQLQVGTQLID